MSTKPTQAQLYQYQIPEKLYQNNTPATRRYQVQP